MTFWGSVCQQTHFILQLHLISCLGAGAPLGGTAAAYDRRVRTTGSAVTAAVMASTAAGRAAVSAAKVVKPILSRDLDEAKRRVRELYRAWYREIPNTGMSDHRGSF